MSTELLGQASPQSSLVSPCTPPCAVTLHTPLLPAHAPSLPNHPEQYNGKIRTCVCLPPPPPNHCHTGALPVAMYSPADLSAVMALQQQQAQAQQQQQQLDDADELQGRALKRPRLVWTAALHKLFEEAVAKIGVNKAVPKTIMQVGVWVCESVRCVDRCGDVRG